MDSAYLGQGEIGSRVDPESGLRVRMTFKILPGLLCPNIRAC